MDKGPPNDMRRDDAPQEVKATDIYEIVTSKSSVAISELKDRIFVPIAPSQAERYTGHYFKCPKGKTPYLVRAVFGHGGTGMYIVKRFGRKLLVVHGSLGRTSVANKSALLLNLDFEPEEIFTDISIVQ